MNAHQDFTQYLLNNAMESYDKLSADYEELENAYDELANLFDELLDEYQECEQFGDQAFNAYINTLCDRADTDSAVDDYIDAIEKSLDDVNDKLKFKEAQVKLLEAQLATANQALDWYREQPVTCKSDFNPWCD